MADQHGNDAVEQAINEQYVTELMSMATEETGWKQESNKENAKVFSRHVPNTNLKAFKFETTLNDCSLISLVDLLHNQMPERHKEWNETYKSGVILEKIDDNKNVQSWRYHVAGLKDREFVVARKKIDQSDGSVILIDKSIDYPGAPENSQVIRCGLPFNVRYFKPLEENLIHLTYMNLTDLGGWFPHWLLNRTNASVSLKEIKHIKEVCQADTAKANQK